MNLFRTIKPRLPFTYRYIRKQKFTKADELAFNQDVENYLKNNEITKLPAKHANGSQESLFDKIGNFSNPTSMKVSPY